MVTNLDLTDSAFGTVFSLIKRIFIVAAALVWGATIGFISAWVNHVMMAITASQRVAESGELDESLYSLSKLTVVLELLIAALPIFYALINIIKGTIVTRTLLAALIGAGYVTITVTRFYDWNPSVLTWILFVLLLAHAWYLISRWNSKQREKFELHLSKIYEENELRRESKK